MRDRRSPEFRKPTSQQLESFIQPTYQALIDGAKYSEPRLREIVAKHRPDVLVEDNVVLFPALVTSGAPFVRIVSCSPLEVPGPGVPPPFSGLPSADAEQWESYRAEFDRMLEESYTGTRPQPEASRAFWNGELHAGPQLP